MTDRSDPLAGLPPAFWPVRDRTRAQRPVAPPEPPAPDAPPLWARLGAILAGGSGLGSGLPPFAAPPQDGVSRDIAAARQRQEGGQ